MNTDERICVHPCSSVVAFLCSLELMIIDLEKFLADERPAWAELELSLKKLEEEPNLQLSLEQARRFHYLYQRASADLARLMTFAHEPAMRLYLESLVARAYGEIHETRYKKEPWRPWVWISRTFPQTFRRYQREFLLSLVVTLAGSAFGGLAALLDATAKEALMPFQHLQGNPSERVAREEREQKQRDPLQGAKTSFSSELMTHNTKVSIFTMALGMTWGVGTIMMLFYNGIGLGAISVDYAADGQTRFLLGWLMPHGVIEIPAILIAGQAGLALALGLIGWGKRAPMGTRLREVSQDVVTLSFGFGLLLVWAGFVEAFLSQYHEPIVPYDAKIAFGAIELVLLCLYLAKSGTGQ